MAKNILVRGNLISNESNIYGYNEAKAPSLVSKLFDNKDFSDVTISVGEGEQAKEFNCHKPILANASGYFQKALYKDSPASSGTIELPDHDVIITGKALEFVYTEDYNFQDEESDVMRHAEMFCKGIDLDIEPLRDLAMDKLSFWTERSLTTYNDPESVIEALDFIWEKSAAADRKTSILLPVARHYHMFMEHPEFRKLSAKYPDIIPETLNAYHSSARLSDQYAANILLSGVMRSKGFMYLLSVSFAFYLFWTYIFYFMRLLVISCVCFYFFTRYTRKQ